MRKEEWVRHIYDMPPDHDKNTCKICLERKKTVRRNRAAQLRRDAVSTITGLPYAQAKRDGGF